MDASNRRIWPGAFTELIKKPVGILILAALVILLVGTTVYVNLKKQVTITDNGKTVAVTTFKSSVKDLLAEKNIKLRKEDEVIPSIDSKLKNGMKVSIKRAYPVVIHVDGKDITIYTVKPTLKDVLAQGKIILSPIDKISTPLDSKTYSGMNVTITRVNEKVITQDEDIAFNVQTIQNDNMIRGQTLVVQEGQNGKREKTIKITYEDGKEVSRQVIKDVVVQNPITKIVQVGTLGLLTTSRGETYRYREMKIMDATGYDAPPGSLTYSGATVGRGIIAVDPRVIPLGTRLYVEGYGPGVAADIGEAIKGNIIDLFFTSYREACNWGRRTVRVYILK
ncbi:G5 domain-containing protein [Thermoanaerobacterium thermosulfurigenes]|uniref:G5 domain-containing protein n=1 Tax=Thermoanaerobacterium thermosulfurigenes TaxID=33950 RepID=UPI003EF22AFC